MRGLCPLAQLSELRKPGTVPARTYILQTTAPVHSASGLSPVFLAAE